MKKPFQILLIEDNPADVYLLRMALTNARLSFELKVIDDGALALAYVQRHGEDPSSPIPDLAVLDLNLPKIEGLQILQAIRSSLRFAEVPVVITTSSRSEEERARSVELGVKEFLTKPPDLESFLKMGTILKDILLVNSKCLER